MRMAVTWVAAALVLSGCAVKETASVEPAVVDYESVLDTVRVRSDSVAEYGDTRTGAGIRRGGFEHVLWNEHWEDVGRENFPQALAAGATPATVKASKGNVRRDGAKTLGEEMKRVRRDEAGGTAPSRDYSIYATRSGSGAKSGPGRSKPIALDPDPRNRRPAAGSEAETLNPVNPHR